MTGGEDSEAGFGRFLASVAERDVDLLLMEEFHISPNFVEWFCEQISIKGAAFAGAWHSVSDTDGETDLLLRIHWSSRRIGVLIENKVAAPEQDLQSERYHLRGIRSQEAGKFDSYVTVMCAPQRYLDSLPKGTAYQHVIPYEPIAEWYGRQGDARSQWRCRVMKGAIEQGRRGYTMAVNETNSKFHRDYWLYLVRHHPKLTMAKPTSKGSKSNWIIIKAAQFPPNVKIHHKVDQQTVELGFQGYFVEDVLRARADWPDDIHLMQKGKTASLVIDVPAVDMRLGVEAQLGAIRAALDAAYRLVPHALLLSAEDQSGFPVRSS